MEIKRLSAQQFEDTVLKYDCVSKTCCDIVNNMRNKKVSDESIKKNAISS